MFRLRMCAILAASSALFCGRAFAQTTVIWEGGDTNANFSVASNWFGGAAPINNGTEFLGFISSQSDFLNLDIPANLFGLLVPGGTNSEIDVKITGSSLTLGTGGIIVGGGDTSAVYLKIRVPVVLSAGQSWVISNSTIDVSGAISGTGPLAIIGAGPNAIASLDSGASTFGGGLTVLSVVNSATLVVGASTTGPAGHVSSGPVGTGTLTIGDGSAFTATPGGPITIGNNVVVGDSTSGNLVTFGGIVNSNSSAPYSAVNLTLTGQTSAPEMSTQIEIGSNSSITFAGSIAATQVGSTISFSGQNPGQNNNSVAILQGNLTNVSLVNANGVALIFDPSPFPGPGVSQVSSLSTSTGIATGTNSNTYVGMGSQFGVNATGVSTFMSKLSPGAFFGTLGFDTTSGATQVFNQPIDLTSFTIGNFVGLGSATSAILGPLAVITPVNGALGDIYQFGGGGGTLTVKSALVDGSTARVLALGPGNAPLTLILQSSGNLYSADTGVNGAALIFDNSMGNIGPGSLLVGYGGVPGYIGYTQAPGITAAQFLAMFGTVGTKGVVGFDTNTGSTRIVSDAIDLTQGGISPFTSSIFIGTATDATLESTITPVSNVVGYQFTGVKGGQLTVATVLGDVGGTTGVTIGLPNPIESFGIVSAVTLSGVNTYTGGTKLNSGILYVTNPASLGVTNGFTGVLTVPNPVSFFPVGAVATLAASGGTVTLNNPILVPMQGLALNFTGSPKLVLNAQISDDSSGGSLVINGPVNLNGNNSYSGYTTINNATVTIGNNQGLGTSTLTATGSTLNFTSPLPSLQSPTFSSSIVNFTSGSGGNPQLTNLQLDNNSTLNFAPNSTPKIVDMLSDAINSGNLINIGTGAQLTLQVDDPSYHGTFAGAGRIIVTTQSSTGAELDLDGASTSFTGGTTLATPISGGLLLVAGDNSALGTGTVTVNQRTALGLMPGVVLANPVALNIGGSVGGYGTFAPASPMTFVFQGGSTVVAGSGLLGGGGGGGGNSQIKAPGLLQFGSNASITFGPLGAYQFSIMNATGTPGTDYSSMNIGGNLNITASAGLANEFTIQLVSVDPKTGKGGLGYFANFNSSQPYTWTLLSADGGITGFSASAFAVNSTASFANSPGMGNFFVTQAGNNLVLNFAPVPEPSTWALMASGLCALGAAVRRRRR